MQHYLATKSGQTRKSYTKRFAPRLWTVDFPRPSLAAITNPKPDFLKIDVEFYKTNEIVGVIWKSEDTWSHPLLSYETNKNYDGVILSFFWKSGPGIAPLNSIHGSVLTVEGRDEWGSARVWYVRLWNYATDENGEIKIEIDFSQLFAGFDVKSEKIYPGDIDRLFISIANERYNESENALNQPIFSWVHIYNIVTHGKNSTINIGDASFPAHSLRMCSGYDDVYNQCPNRLVEQWIALGYRNVVNHYVGMSHYYSLKYESDDRFIAQGRLSTTATSWHQSFFEYLYKFNFSCIISISMELLDQNTPSEWAQRNLSGSRALTGWDPPSTLLSPCCDAAMNWLANIASDFASVSKSTLPETSIQIGEPWWWVDADKTPYFYDQYTVDRWVREKGALPPHITDIRGTKTALEREWLDWLGSKLADATFYIRQNAQEAVNEAPFNSLLLFYSPQIISKETPELIRANMPSSWINPAWDIIQLENYDYVTEDNEYGLKNSNDVVRYKMGYSYEKMHYFSGFVADPTHAGEHWYLITKNINAAFNNGFREVFVWAWPQIARDGYCFQQLDNLAEETAMKGFHDVSFPLEVGLEAVGGPKFLTQVITETSGREHRNMQWSNGRIYYDTGVGIRSEADLEKISKFFRARRGRAFGFRFRDPLDHSSSNIQSVPSFKDQVVGIGDGNKISFQLVKSYSDGYGTEVRNITRPIPYSVVVGINEIEVKQRWSIKEKGLIQFDQPPDVGAVVTAGFYFDVPVRFAVDNLEISANGFASGDIISLPVVEIVE